MIRHCAFLTCSVALFVALPALTAAPAPKTSTIKITGCFATDKAQERHFLNGAIVLDIPKGVLVLGPESSVNQFLTELLVSVYTPKGWNDPVSYVRCPTPAMQEDTARTFHGMTLYRYYYEGRTVLRFEVPIPPGYQGRVLTLRARLVYESRNSGGWLDRSDRELVFPPITIASEHAPVKQINREFFRNNVGEKHLAGPVERYFDP